MVDAFVGVFDCFYCPHLLPLWNKGAMKKMNLILWVVLFALIGLGKYAIGEIKQNRKTKGIALLIVTIVLMIAWFALKGHMSRNLTY